MKTPTGKPKRQWNRVTAEQKARALSLVTSNPTLSIGAIARHVEVCPNTVSAWFKEWNLKRWFSR